MSLELGEAVGVGPRERPHEGALAVVDVPRGADGDVVLLSAHVL